MPTEFTAKEAALYLDISPHQLYTMRSIGRLKGMKINDSLVFTQEELDTFNDPDFEPPVEELDEETAAFFDYLFTVLDGTIQEPSQHIGRPRQSMRDMVFCMLYKVHARLPVRRVLAALQYAQAHHHISSVPHFNTILRYLNNPAMSPLLRQLAHDIFLEEEQINKTIAMVVIEDVPMSSKTPTALVNERLCRIIGQKVFELFTQWRNESREEEW